VKIRGYLALGIICIAFPFFDLFQRTVVALYVRIRPSRRLPMMTWWIQSMRGFVLGCFEKIGGARLSVPERVVASGPGTLIVMNHQSLLDIPLVVGTVRDGYPRIVTRRRYYRFIPLISHMVRLYQYPVVDPRAKADHVRQSLVSLSEAALDSEVPIGIFPEGTRTKDGEIGRFKTRGLAALMAERKWTVHVFVVDGFWKVAKFRHFLSGMAHITGSSAYLGSLEWTEPGADPQPFIDAIRDGMIEGLRALRAGEDPTGRLALPGAASEPE
jgi:1-acyl-sn-glycerol-3-phosphate acyltransferase